MNGRYQDKIYLALVHYPVKNKNGQTITSAVTNLDLHDIARAAKTYGVGAFYVVTPLEDQKELVEKIVSHWTEGFGRIYNPKRFEALSLIRIKDSLPQVIEEITQLHGMPVKVVATCAADTPQATGYDEFRQMLDQNDGCYLIVLGTAWGLTGEFLESADLVLKPVKGQAEYNHLSVRSAASIILDRIMGKDR
ncbi:MAG: RNA methyltransferase [Desulfobacterales bacterium]|nr:RNA methyltransferase [Desulfobacterales bacterium]